MNGSFRENLRAELDYQDMSVKELCAKTGIPKATVECYLGARANMPSADAACKIAGALGVTVESLVTGSSAAATDARDIKIRELIRLVREFDREEYQAILSFAKTIKKLREQKRPSAM
jgi:transcriptional regulator with XRE-family HTH domain